MPPQWVQKPLSEFIVLQRGFDLPHHKRVPGRFRVLSSGAVSGSHNEGPVKGPGFVVGRATNIGRPTWSDDDYWPLNTVLYAKDFLGNDPRFAYYWFLSTDLTAYNSGSVQPMLNRNYIANVPISIPPLIEQRGIAATLAALDRKIESNKRSVRLIEKLLLLEFQKLLCKEPVEYRRLSDLATITKGVSYKSVDLQTSTTSLVTLKSFDRKGGYKVDGLKQYTGPYKPQQVLQPGEVVVAQTDLTQGAEVVGRAVRVPADSSADVLVASLDLAIVRPTSAITLEYLLGLLVDEAFREHCRSRTSGTTVLHLAGDAIPSYMAPIASASSQESFSTLSRPLLAKADSLNAETVELAKLRDALMPEVLSGRIRVPEAKEATA
jgi:type I restriction enzyme S subunit